MTSFIVPVYNVAPYLEKCIESIIAQTLPAFELILVDDGSTDNSAAICDEWAVKDSRIQVIHQTNQGVSVARNVGLAAASGDWIIFVDSDDWIDKQLLETIAPYYDSDNDLIFFGFTEVFPNKSIEKRLDGTVTFLGPEQMEYFQLGVLNRYQKGPFDFTKINISSSWAKAYRKSLIQKNGATFPPDIFSNEDSLFNCAVFNNAETGVYLPTCLYYYRQISSSASNRYNPRFVENFHKAAYLFATLLKEQKSSRKVWDAYYHKVTTFFQFCTVQYLCHPSNNKAFTVRRKEFLRLRNSEPYAEAFAKVDISTLPLAKKMCIFFLQKRMFFCMELLTKLYSTKRLFP